MRTHTHTVFFGDDDLKDIRQCADVLQRDMESRAPFISADLLARMKRRMDILNAAIYLLGEEAD